MNRRGFFKLLGAAAPAIFVPKLIVPVWKPLVKPQWRPNPAWVNAEFEVAFLESAQFNFIPSFTDFWRGYLKQANTDITTRIVTC